MYRIYSMGTLLVKRIKKLRTDARNYSRLNISKEFSSVVFKFRNVRAQWRSGILARVKLVVYNNVSYTVFHRTQEFRTVHSIVPRNLHAYFLKHLKKISLKQLTKNIFTCRLFLNLYLPMCRLVYLSTCRLIVFNRNNWLTSSSHNIKFAVQRKL